MVIPRVVIAGTSSGAGKTTVACGLIGALRARGSTVQGFKVGPDYIDPSYHALASGRPGRNLDAFLSGPELIAPLAGHGAQGADIAVIEGVMGLFDGASGRGELASTGHIAKLLKAPVLLVVDAASMARSAAAIVHGYSTFDPDLALAGIIFNHVGSDHHEQLLREAVEPLGIPVLGALRRDERIRTPERHLGLVPAGEREERSRAALVALAQALARYTDLEAIERLARAAPPLAGPAWSPEPPSAPTGDARIAVARGRAFSFHYEENLELLSAAGAELWPFDPTTDEALPEGAGALVLAGGFPEVFGSELEANAALRAQVAAFAAAGRPILAECGGLLFLLDGLDGHEMCGVLPGRATMSRRLTLGYREAVAATATPWLEAGERVRGHEFHYSQVTRSDEGTGAAWTLSARGTERTEGFVAGAVQASYLHVHWAAHPELAWRFARAASAARAAA
ncbi:MAG TPA: cobyrinate a,c-diamide synthase [Solirubrobacteraceae bacterium]|jgi:cobyrinic acid a,c-diamide synthase|nr:cobyrinate a,c-diamide synthase [Solirubrobacteraceae bacterium]